LSPDKGHCWC